MARLSGLPPAVARHPEAVQRELRDVGKVPGRSRASHPRGQLVITDRNEIDSDTRLARERRDVRLRGAEAIGLELERPHRDPLRRRIDVLVGVAPAETARRACRKHDERDAERARPRVKRLANRRGPSWLMRPRFGRGSGRATGVVLGGATFRVFERETDPWGTSRDPEVL